jgi:hypothetical protein
MRVFELFQALREITAARGCRPPLARSPKIAQPIDGDRTQPGAEGARPLPLENGQLAHQNGEHVLGKIIDVRLLQALAT